MLISNIYNKFYLFYNYSFFYKIKFLFFFLKNFLQIHLNLLYFKILLTIISIISTYNIDFIFFFLDIFNFLKIEPVYCMEESLDNDTDFLIDNVIAEVDQMLDIRNISRPNQIFFRNYYTGANYTYVPFTNIPFLVENLSVEMNLTQNQIIETFNFISPTEIFLIEDRSLTQTDYIEIFELMDLHIGHILKIQDLTFLKVINNYRDQMFLNVYDLNFFNELFRDRINTEYVRRIDIPIEIRSNIVNFIIEEPIQNFIFQSQNFHNFLINSRTLIAENLDVLVNIADENIVIRPIDQQEGIIDFEVDNTIRSNTIPVLNVDAQKRYYENHLNNLNFRYNNIYNNRPNLPIYILNLNGFGVITRNNF